MLPPKRGDLSPLCRRHHLLNEQVSSWSTDSNRAQRIRRSFLRSYFRSSGTATPTSNTRTPTDIARIGSSIYAASFVDELIALNLSDGNLRWKFATGTPNRTALCLRLRSLWVTESCTLGWTESFMASTANREGHCGSTISVDVPRPN
jgi:hypothetical protein